MDKELIGSEILYVLSFSDYRLDNVSVSSIYYKQNIYYIHV